MTKQVSQGKLDTTKDPGEYYFSLIQDWVEDTANPKLFKEI